MHSEIFPVKNFGDFLRLFVASVIIIVGPQCANPAKFIRFIYNRVILENEVVRAASIAALAKFGTVPKLTDSVLTLLQRSMVDEDDEVRDRATFYYHVLKLKSAQLNSQMIINGLIVSLPALERQLQSYLQSGAADERFNMKSVPVMAVKEEVEKTVIKKKEPNKQEQDSHWLCLLVKYDSTLDCNV